MQRPRRPLAFSVSSALLAGSLALSGCTDATVNPAPVQENNSSANNSSANNSAVNNSTPNNSVGGNNGSTNGNNSTDPGNNANNSVVTPTPCDACEGCQLLYADSDGDGVGSGEASCQAPGPGLAAVGGDCAPEDPTRFPSADGVCGDWVDDSCDGQDEACPTTQQAAVQIPDWDCTGEPPASVLAWVRFGDGGGHVEDGFCFMAFEGLPGELYVAPVNLSFTRPGSTCPVGYDVRMYAHLVDDPATCPPLELIVHGPNEHQQQVSTDCRRFLYHMTSRAPYVYLGSDVEEVRRRFTEFGTAEVACSGYEGWSQFNYELLLRGEVEINGGFSGE